MTSIREAIYRLIAPPKPLPAGIYHYQAPQDDPRNYRLHLRLEPDGSGVLIVNAATILHLNQTAAEYAYHLVKRTPQDTVASSIAARYHVSQDQALQDFTDLLARIDMLVTTTDLDPVTYLDFVRQRPYSGPITAPYRLDCALTYRLMETSPVDAVSSHRASRELTTSEWETVIDKAWEIGIPQIIFTGGEPTLRDDLIGLINRAETNGQVTGLATNGRALGDKAYLETLLRTGLDHLLLIPHSTDAGDWTILQSILLADIFTTVHLTITPQNQEYVTGILGRLADMGVKSISLSAMSDDLSSVLLTTREQAAALGLSLVWDLPVPYSDLNPFALEFVGRERSLGAGRAWLYVEPDGDVLPDQGSETVLGNILNDPWDKIWRLESD